MNEFHTQKMKEVLRFHQWITVSSFGPEKNYAYLYDSVALHFGIKQKFGTQATVLSQRGRIELRPYEGTLLEIDIRRKAMGLEPVNKYLKTLEEVYLTPLHKVVPANDIRSFATARAVMLGCAT